ncbi:MAG: hypothetical protein JXA46_14760 [Dehalococcoidales bacterium]|nr:hypothetical protein [Dehalococcoidales bacterium]
MHRQYLTGIIPTFWVSRAFVSSFSNIFEYGLALAGGLAVSMVILLLFLRKFIARTD